MFARLRYENRHHSNHNSKLDTENETTKWHRTVYFYAHFENI